MEQQFGVSYKILKRDPVSIKKVAWLEVMMNLTAFKASGVWACASSRIRRTIFVVATLGALFFLASCTNTSASGPHATLLMRDGTMLAGTVTATSPAQITLVGDDNATHVVPMTQVKSIEYDDAAAPT